MEVHAHAHTVDPDSHRGRKKWKHYFWEFLMLFMAVTLGFFVENQREHYVENQRAEILAQSLVEDLRKDTASLSVVISRCKQKINSLKELVRLLRSYTDSKNDSLIYKHAVLIQYATRFLRAAGTYEQIVNSGSLRYFSQPLVNLMNQYDVDITMVESRRDADLNIIFNISLSFINKNFNQEVFDEILENKPVTKKMYNNFVAEDTQNEIINNAIVSRRITERMKIESEIALQSAIELINSLEKKYDLN